MEKPHLRSTSIQCYLCLLLNSHFLTEAGIHIFILGCTSASLPKTEANWNDVMSDLNAIKNLIQSIHIDATLYTESDAHAFVEVNPCGKCILVVPQREVSDLANNQPSCKVTAMKCFLLELRVIFQETNNKDIRRTIDNLIFLANNSLPSDGNVTESGCKECEELEEKNVKDFLGSFTHIVQMFINTPLQ